MPFSREEYAFIEDGKGEIIAHTLGTFPQNLRKTFQPMGDFSSKVDRCSSGRS